MMEIMLKMREFSISWLLCCSTIRIRPKDEVDADGEVEHSTLKLPSQVSETPDKQQEEDEGDSKSKIHTAIREKVRDNIHIWQLHIWQ